MERTLIDRTVRLAVALGIAAVASAACRAVLTRLGGRSGPLRLSGSFDTWPAVVPAPRRPSSAGGDASTGPSGPPDPAARRDLGPTGP